MATVPEHGEYLIVASGTSSALLDILDANKGTLATGYKVKELAVVCFADCTGTINGKYPASFKANAVVELGEGITSVVITENAIPYQIVGKAIGSYTYET